jgi:hypothetical protein
LTGFLRVTAKWKIPRLHTPKKTHDPKQLDGLNVEYLGSTQNHLKQLEGLNVEYLGSSQNHTKQLDWLNVEYLGSTQNHPKQFNGLAATNTAMTLCCGQQEQTMLSLGQQQQTTLAC